MDLSKDVYNVTATMRILNKGLQEPIGSNKSNLSHDFHNNIVMEELIEIDKINFSSDETWLYECPLRNPNIKDLKEWLYRDVSNLKDYSFLSNHLTLIREIAHIDSKKSIDSRTFTRPKKRLNRPSIEMYNAGYFKMDKSSWSDSNKYETESETSTLKCDVSVDSSTCIKSIPSENVICDNNAPLNFDFSQPTSSSIFDIIVATAPDVDSFQNMSPPSLVNSMCSSTFTNLMENSMIKNDPVLREIRDADYTEDMLQDCDPPLLKSFTDSCSSINSDTPEGFLKKAVDTTFSKIYKKNVTVEKENSLNETYTADNTVVLDCTYRKDSSSDISSADICSIGTQPDAQLQRSTVDLNTAIISSSPVLNGTYRKSVNSKLNNTFQKSSNYCNNDDLNQTVVIADNVDSNRISSNKRRSYIIDNRTCDLNRTTNLKRNSVGYSAGSTDSLDYMSSLSSSSKGSNKMLNMAEVDAIVLQQEQSLQVASTPKQSSKIINKLWENNLISPIPSLDRGDHMSDSEASSNDDYLTVGSSTSSMQTPIGSETQVMKTNRSLEHFSPKTEVPKSNPRSLNVIPTKTISNKSSRSGSYSNLKTVGTNLKGSYTNLRPSSAGIKGSYTNLVSVSNSTKGSCSNLKTMSTHLKSSYTQLKPVLSNLPHTDTNLKVLASNAPTLIKQRNNPPPLKVSSSIKIAEVAPTLRDVGVREQVKSASTVNSARLPVKASALPRLVSAIPRPMGSRIPGPRTVRPTSSRPLSRPSSKLSMDCDF